MSVGLMAWVLGGAIVVAAVRAAIRPRAALPRGEATTVGLYATIVGWSCGWAALGILASTSFGSMMFSSAMQGWALLAHFAAAPLLMIGAVLLGSSARAGLSGGGVLWASLALALVAMLTVLAAMSKWFGYDAQRTLLEVHRYSGLGLLALAIIGLGGLARRRHAPADKGNG